jgi:hypothetical protein
MSVVRQSRTECINSDAAPNPDVVVNRRVPQRRVPHRLRVPPANQSFSLPQQALLSCVSRQAQFRLSFTLRSEAAQLWELSRWNGPSFWNPSPGAALALRTPAFRPSHPRCLHRCWPVRSRSRGIFQVVFAPHPGFYGGIFRLATALAIPPRSAFGPPTIVNPAAVIKPSMSPAWPRPASTTSAPPVFKRRAASGISTR